MSVARPKSVAFALRRAARLGAIPQLGKKIARPSLPLLVAIPDWRAASIFVAKNRAGAGRKNSFSTRVKPSNPFYLKEDESCHWTGSARPAQDGVEANEAKATAQTQKNLQPLGNQCRVVEFRNMAA